LLGACDDRGPARLEDCGGDLRGVWESERGAWHAIPGDGTWELYPMFDDRPAGAGAAPGVIDLVRQPPGAPTLDGTYSRRYQRGAGRCDDKAAVRLRDCRGDRAVLEVAPPAPPIDFTSCAAPPSPPEVWELRRAP